MDSKTVLHHNLPVLNYLSQVDLRNANKMVVTVVV